MKKTIRIFLTLILVLTMTCGMTNVVLASDDGGNNVEELACFFDDYFTSNEMYTVYDKNDVDISAAFYEETLQWYEAGEIENIYRYIKVNVSRCKKEEIIENQYAKGAIQKKKQTETFFGFVNNSTINDYDIVYTLTGQFSYNANTGKVTSYSNPKINLTYVGIANMVSGQMKNASTSAKKTTDGYGVVFKGQFDVLTTLSISGPLDSTIELRNETTGPYKASFTAYGS